MRLSRAAPALCRNPYEIQVNTKPFPYKVWNHFRWLLRRNPYEIQVNTKPRSVSLTKLQTPDCRRNPYEIQVNTKRGARSQGAGFRQEGRNPYEIQVNTKELWRQKDFTMAQIKS